MAESGGDSEGAGRALLIVIEEMCETLDFEEMVELGQRLDRLLGQSQQASVQERLHKCRRLLAQGN